MKFIKFFFILWVIFALLDPDTDPGTSMNPDPIQIRIFNIVSAHERYCAFPTLVPHRQMLREVEKGGLNPLRVVQLGIRNSDYL